MSIATTCPSCEAFFRLSDELAGKRVQCQKCKARFIVPSAGTKESQPGIPVEAVSAAPPAKAPTVAPPARRPIPAPVSADPDKADDEDETPRRKRRAEPDNDDEEERPRRKRRAEPVADADDEDERPRRKRRAEASDDDEEERPRRSRRDEPDDEDEDDRPRRRKKKGRRSSEGSRMPLILTLVGLGVLLLVVCGGVGTFLLTRNANPNPGGPIPVILGADGTFRTDGAFRLWDATKDRKHFRMYSLRMEAGKTYEIDMNSNNIDSYIVVLDDNNQVVMEDDDSGGALNARVIFRPQRDGDFRIEASTFDDRETGNYTLIVRRR